MGFAPFDQLNDLGRLSEFEQEVIHAYLSAPEGQQTPRTSRKLALGRLSPGSEFSFSALPELARVDGHVVSEPSGWPYEGIRNNPSVTTYNPYQMFSRVEWFGIVSEAAVEVNYNSPMQLVGVRRERSTPLFGYFHLPEWNKPRLVYEPTIVFDDRCVRVVGYANTYGEGGKSPGNFTNIQPFQRSAVSPGPLLVGFNNTL